MKNIDRKQKTREESRGSISYFGVLLILLGNIQHWAKERERGEKKEEEKKRKVKGDSVLCKRLTSYETAGWQNRLKTQGERRIKEEQK